jgi:RimJ/RimL family protein N-acetyltransferase
MTYFKPGKIIAKFESKNNLPVTVRYPKWSDLEQMTDYINEISLEDTFLTMSGEQYTINQEAGFLGSKFAEIEAQNSILALAFIEDEFIGICNIDRDLSQRTRGYHRFKLGITIKEKYRNQGIGKLFVKLSIQEARLLLPNFKILLLDLFAENTAALKTYEKLGFEQVGLVKNAFYRQGKYSDQLLMALHI